MWTRIDGHTYIMAIMELWNGLQVIGSNHLDYVDLSINNLQFYWLVTADVTAELCEHFRAIICLFP